MKPLSVTKPPSSIVMASGLKTSGRLSTFVEASFPRGVPLSMPSNEPHASGALANRAISPAAAMRP
jgi:hypothetical protein